ncbi:hypothetical protein CEXT_256621 [Caerostris extrusa]|uniref:Uncharacterized protein n=1 Tax=Caerostris extrusa TaxID=172846 RepID=A0AAV4R6R3_CAEEX|nr:hypothetical protein CEXT_256621 [Caerostris extrusa]
MNLEGNLLISPLSKAKSEDLPLLRSEIDFTGEGVERSSHKERKYKGSRGKSPASRNWEGVVSKGEAKIVCQVVVTTAIRKIDNSIFSCFSIRYTFGALLLVSF